MERLDFFQMGLGGASKSAAILVQILVVGLFSSSGGNAWLKRVLFFVAVCSASLLVLTGSRGGLLAALLAALTGFFMRRPDLNTRTVCLTTVFLVFVLFLAAWSGFTGRVLGVFNDPSALARLDLWKGGMSMLAAAPHGWGAGNSGEVYMQWYQPLEKGYQFRTLLNDHLTWLTEHGITFKITYFCAWGGVLGLCWPRRGETLKRTAFLVWVAFFVASCFSRIAEFWMVWIIPACLLLILLASAMMKKHHVSIRHALSGALVSVFIGCLLYVSSWVMLRNSQLRVLRQEDEVLITPSVTSRNTIGLKVDRKVIGEIYGPSVRKLVYDLDAPVRVLGSGNENTIHERGLESIILCGYAGESRLFTGMHYVLLNPCENPFRDSEVPDVNIVVGQFSANRNRPWLRKKEHIGEDPVLVVEGMGNYLPDWNEPVASILKGRGYHD